MKKFFQELFRALAKPGHAPAQADPNAAGEEPTSYLSLEFLIEDSSYWFCSSTKGGRVRHFVNIPVAAFGGHELNPGRLAWEAGNSELYLFADDGTNSRFSSVDENDYKTLDLGPFDRISWNRMCELAIAHLDPQHWTGLYHSHIVRVRPDSKFELRDVGYQVTGFLPDDGTVALCGNDHDPPTTINWRSFVGLETPEALREFLSDFRVEAICLGDQFFSVE